MLEAMFPRLLQGHGRRRGLSGPYTWWKWAWLASVELEHDKRITRSSELWQVVDGNSWEGRPWGQMCAVGQPRGTRPGMMALR